MKIGKTRREVKNIYLNEMRRIQVVLNNHTFNMVLCCVHWDERELDEVFMEEMKLD